MNLKVYIVILLSLFQRVGTASQCNEISLYHSKNIFSVFHDFFEGSLEGFKTLNVNGGFLTYGDRVIFAAPKSDQAFEVATSLGLNNPAKIKVKELENWIAVDVSGAPGLSPITRKLHGRRSIMGDARCYSAVLAYHEITGGAANVSERAFEHYMMSPLMKNLSSSEILSGKTPIKQGDVVAIGRGDVKVPTDHVAVFENGNVIFHKPTPMVESPFNLMTFDSLKREYPPGEFFYKFFRPVESLKTYVARNQNIIDVTMWQFLETLFGNQKVMDLYTLSRRDNPRHPFDLPEKEKAHFYQNYKFRRQQTIANAESILAYAKAEILKLKKKPGVNEDLLFIWEYILISAETTTEYSDPFGD